MLPHEVINEGSKMPSDYSPGADASDADEIWDKQAREAFTQWILKGIADAKLEAEKRGENG